MTMTSNFTDQTFFYPKTTFNTTCNSLPYFLYCIILTFTQLLDFNYQLVGLALFYPVKLFFLIKLKTIVAYSLLEFIRVQMFELY